jgi:hypothetical protein
VLSTLFSYAITTLRCVEQNENDFKSRMGNDVIESDCGLC